jgi:outer membrane immunogenic protein
VNRILFAALAAATALTATPALAQDAAPAASSFTGPRVGLNVGFADEDVFGTELFTYGVEAGYDFDLGSAVVGVTAEAQDSDETGRDLSIVGRAGFKATPKFLVYALGGYTNLKVSSFTLDGYRLGGGVEFAPAQHVSLKLEQRYSNYELGLDAWQTVAGIGYRF